MARTSQSVEIKIRLMFAWGWEKGVMRSDHLWVQGFFLE